ncbi:MAG TPA: long-chain-acyl-CoA synthetase [Caulobacteraceae bacterium]|jgi:fatty-acyl-CoA synthase
MDGFAPVVPVQPLVGQGPPPAKGGANRAWLRALETTSQLSEAGRTLPQVVDDLGRTWGETPALLSEQETLTYAGLAARARAYTRWALSQGLGKGDVVAVLMPNRPDYMALWLGLTRIGAVAALLNTNLAGPSLAHAISVVSAGCLIASPELANRAKQALAHLEEQPRLWIRGGEGEGALSLDPKAFDDAPLDDAMLPRVSLKDRALHIYTSGTTGLPKAANVSHGRLLMWAGWFAGMMGAGPDDRLYNCLPMYHSVGGVVATGAMLLKGGSVVIREKFSARRFWPEVVAWDCTVFQYIGELCRYLTAAPHHPLERGHRLRLVCGNGLREGVWRAFQERFAVPQVLEFYAATEGVFSLYNAEGKPGAVGRTPPFLAHRFPAVIVRLDLETSEPTRDADGRCIRCDPDEAGEAIGRIAEASGDAANRFEGYTSAAETEKKVLRDVFAPGDAWMRTGDLMRRDRQGFYYFVDRLGDTFRWKGENVSAAEVADAIAACPGVQEAAVYGVIVPRAEGRAGMAAIVAGDGFEFAELRDQLSQALPTYARPLFIRLASQLTATETFKPKKQVLQAEGFDPERVQDPLYFLDPAEGAYLPLDKDAHDRIVSGELRL